MADTWFKRRTKASARAEEDPKQPPSLAADYRRSVALGIAPPELYAKRVPRGFTQKFEVEEEKHVPVSEGNDDQEDEVEEESEEEVIELPEGYNFARRAGLPGQFLRQQGQFMLDTASWSGPVCDLMERKRHLEASSGTAPSPEDTKLIVEGRDMVSQERLSSTIFDLILHNRKSLGVWPKTPSRVFRDWAIRISDLKREVKDLHKEAHSWNKRHKLHEIREPRTEPPDTKEKALLFWLEHQHHAWNLSTEPRGEEHSPRSKGLSTTNLKSPKSMAKTQSLGSLLSRPPQVPTRNGG
eukprot:CAMPEP_0115161030 /NCGR_PEP_ID=MMETSP0227-20121206/71126_1 /TAXON_ID=89957 /ORGANISM="Polarella glacialis, Strain CCMP 1383" /LENGTH=296 /DNA_ID=CAMNT_0002572977 /DNA_START=8 /DNA_END=894 /DNA_ORIENTATION=-